MSLLETSLPDNRRWRRVGDYYAVTKKPRGMDMSSFNEIPFAPMDAVPQGGDYDARYTLKTFSEITSGTYFEKNDLLIAKITPSFENGKQALAFNLPSAFGYASTEIIPIHPINEDTDRRLLFFYLLHPDIRSYVAEKMEGSTGRQRVPENALLDLPFPEIKSDDQKIISDALYLVQQGRKKEQAAEKNTQELKRAAMRELFTKGLRGEPQKQTDIGLVPESWDIKAVGGYIHKPDYGFTASASSEAVGPRFLRITDIQDGGVNWDTVPFCASDTASVASKGLKKNDIVVARIGATTGKAFIIGECPEAIFASYLIRIRTDETKLVPAFLYYYMQTDAYWQHIDQHKGGRLKGGVNIPILSSLPIPIVEKEEQREIAQILDAIDRKIDLHKRKKAVLEELFKSLLHKLMTGEIRVSDLDLTAIQAGGH